MLTLRPATGSMHALVNLHPKLPEAVRSAVKAFDKFAEVWGKACLYDDHMEAIQKWATELGVHEDDALALLQKASLIGQKEPGDPFSNAQEELQKAVAAIARSYLTTRLARDFLFGLTDLLRLRLTASVGYLRSQSESCGLLRLMAKQPEAAE